MEVRIDLDFSEYSKEIEIQLQQQIERIYGLAGRSLISTPPAAGKIFLIS